MAIIGAGSRPSPQLILAQTIPGGYDPAKAAKLVKELEQAQASGDTQRLNSIRDGFERAANVKPASATAVPQTGATTHGVAPEGGTVSPTESLSSLDPTTRRRVESTHAPQPEANVQPPNPQQLSFAFGDSKYTPAPGLKDTKPTAVSGTGGPQKVQSGAVVDTPPQVEPSGPYVSLENSPRNIAAREAQQLQSQGFRLGAGQTWEGWQKDRTKHLTEQFSAGGGVWQMNPDLLAKEAATRAEAAGFRMSAAQVSALEVDIHNHLMMNGGLLRSGGELAALTQAGMMPGASGMRLFGSTGSAVLGGIAGSGVGALSGMAVGGPLGGLAGGALGGSAGMLLGGLLSSPSMVNPALGMFPTMAGNPAMMGAGGALGTLGMLAGAMTGGPMGALNMAATGQAFSHSFAYAGLQYDSKIRGIMRKNAILQQDVEMQALINNPNIPIEKLVAMWALRQTKRYEEELRDKMQKAEMARQSEKAEENAKEARQGIMGALGSIGTIGGLLLGGPAGMMVGGMVGQMGGGLLGSAMTPGGGMGQPGGQTAQSSTALNLEVQMAMEEWKRGIELASNIMKALHDMQMTIINNTR